MNNILVIGASGFVGSHLCSYLASENFNVTAYSRSPIDLGPSIAYLTSPSFQLLFDEPSLLSKFDSIVYAAGRAHKFLGTPTISCVSQYFSDNTIDPVQIARLASLAGVKRFIYISTIKVNGDSTSNFNSFSSLDDHCPKDIYALSKSLAEKLLGSTLRCSSTSLIIVRPPLIYGPGVKGNLHSLIKFFKYGIPLPFSTLRSNKRSFLSIYNLSDFIRVILLHKDACSQTFLVRDPDETSTHEFLDSYCRSIGFSFKSFFLPRFLLRLVFSLIGKDSSFFSLTSSLRMDISHTLDTLNWTPPYSLKASLEQYPRT